MITFDVLITHKDLRNYMFTHKYRRVTGVVELALGLICFLIGVIKISSIGEQYRPYMLFLIFFGVFFLVISPIQTFTNSARQYLANPGFLKPFTYNLSEEGIEVVQDGESAKLPWSQVYKVSANKTSIFLYMSRFTANILPKRCFADRKTEIEQMFREHVDAKRCKL